MERKEGTVYKAPTAACGIKQMVMVMLNKHSLKSSAWRCQWESQRHTSLSLTSWPRSTLPCSTAKTMQGSALTRGCRQGSHSHDLCVGFTGTTEKAALQRKPSLASVTMGPCFRVSCVCMCVCRVCTYMCVSMCLCVTIPQLTNTEEQALVHTSEF